VSKLNSFEELTVWQLSRELAKDIYGLTQRENFYKDYSLKDQINRSCGSVMDNIAEGFERGGNKEFCQFLYIAKGSNGEIRSQLYRAFDRNHLNKVEFESLKARAENISKQLSGFIHYLKNSDLKGEKFVREPETQYPDLDGNLES
jgi:four helix bundle protein